MKIAINYDLIDKIAEAKHGYSLKRCAKRTLYMLSISSLIGVPDNLMGGNISPDLWVELSAYLACHATFTTVLTLALKNTSQEIAAQMLELLAMELRGQCIYADEAALLNAKKYKTEYSVSFPSAIPIIEQKKYITLPIHDEFFGDRDVSLMQEHVVGTKKYILSLGEPKEQKTYSFGAKKMIQK